MEKNNNIAMAGFGSAAVGAASGTVAEGVVVEAIKGCGYTAAQFGGEVALDLLELIGGSVAPILIIGGLALGFLFIDS